MIHEGGGELKKCPHWTTLYFFHKLNLSTEYDSEN